MIEYQRKRHNAMREKLLKGDSSKAQLLLTQIFNKLKQLERVDLQNRLAYQYIRKQINVLIQSQ